VLNPETGGSVEITGDGLDWKYDRIMITDCQATCGVSSPSSTVNLGSGGGRLGDANTFIAQNNYFDAAASAQTTVDLPSELRTYSLVANAYCRGNDLGGDSLGDVSMMQCNLKCKDDPDSEGCSGYDASFDDASSKALCISEEECRAACTGLESCYGIDMFSSGDRCYLNSRGNDADSCESQHRDGLLGPSLAYNFLGKDLLGNGHGALGDATGLSSANVLRFSDVQSSGGSYKVCFCDSSLLPEGQTHCLGESDYDVEVGNLVVSGVSCLLADQDFRRRTCYPMFHGGLACSDVLEYPEDEDPTTGDMKLPSEMGLQ